MDPASFDDSFEDGVATDGMTTDGYPQLDPFHRERVMGVLSLLTSRKFVVAVFAVLAMLGLDVSAEVQAGVTSMLGLGLILAIAWEDVAKANQMLANTTFNIGDTGGVSDGYGDF